MPSSPGILMPIFASVFFLLQKLPAPTCGAKLPETNLAGKNDSRQAWRPHSRCRALGRFKFLKVRPLLFSIPQRTLSFFCLNVQKTHFGELLGGIRLKTSEPLSFCFGLVFMSSLVARLSCLSFCESD
jgi:hypothetical protein